MSKASCAARCLGVVYQCEYQGYNVDSLGRPLSSDSSSDSRCLIMPHSTVSRNYNFVFSAIQTLMILMTLLHLNLQSQVRCICLKIIFEKRTQTISLILQARPTRVVLLYLLVAVPPLRPLVWTRCGYQTISYHVFSLKHSVLVFLTPIPFILWI